MKAIKQEVSQEFENLHHLHHDSTGIISLCQIVEGKWTNKYYNYKTLSKIMYGLENYEDLFFSQNTFKKCKRSEKHLFELKACYIDLDYYTLGLTKEQVLFGIQNLVNEKSIPIPSMVVDSGHGLNVIWRIKRIPAAAMKLWRAVEEYLYCELKELGADRSCLEPTRVFRVADSWNCKYPIKQKVQILSTYPIEYDLHNLQTYLKFEKLSLKKKKKRYQKIYRMFNTYTLYCSRREDILSLCRLRNFEMTGMREVTLFLYRYYGGFQLTDDEMIERVKILNNQFTKPCKESTILRATRSAKKAAAEEKYNYKNSTLIELLKITDEEMQAQWSDGEYVLKTIISKEEKYRRNNLKRNKKRRNSQGHTSKEQGIKDNLALIKLLKEQGLTQKEIANEMNLSVRSIQKYYKMLRDADENDQTRVAPIQDTGAEHREAEAYRKVN